MNNKDRLFCNSKENIVSLDKTRRNLTQKIESFNLIELLELQRRLSIIINKSEEAEGEEKKKIIQEGIFGYINNPGSAS